jgi:endothelin-converting enzyme/putative endopeptidase
VIILYHHFMNGLKPRAVLLAAILVSAAGAQERPLMSLPYTPSLDAKFMDRSVDPCVDFYKYACGNWIKLNPIPPDQAMWDVYAKLQIENQRYLWGLLEEAARPAPDRTASQQKIGDYFQSCMDEPAVEKAGAGPLEKSLAAIAALRTRDQLASLVASLQLETRGDGMLFGFGSNQDYADSTRIIAFADAGGLGLPDRDYYVNTDAKSQETRTKYVEHVRKMLALLGDSPDAAAKGAGTVMAMETALAKVSLTRVERRDPYKLFHKYTRGQLLKLTPAFRWKEHLDAAGTPSLAEFNVSQPAFYKELNKLLKSHPIADWRVYLRWHLVHAQARYLSSPFERADFEFYSAYLRGIQEMQPRWKRCVQYTDRDLGEALGQEFVRKTFGPDTKARALAMTREIQKAMEQDLHEIAWMGEETKKQALAKLHGMVDKIGYPDQWRDYGALEIKRGDFAGNVTRATVFESRRQLAKIGKPLDRGEWQMTPPTVNAYYDPQMNDINFPAGVLQPPLYDPKLDDAPNYGNTGGTIGHELTHGFDDEGRQFDAKGNLKDWWTNTDAAEFEKRDRCISEQYSQYTVVDDIKINGKLTLGEDTADLGGERLAWMAWKNATRGMDLKPADGLTPEQRFFVGFAQWACGDERIESKRLNAITNPHSPDEYRINGVVSNLPQFRQVFACKAGQPMVHDPVCRVW